MSNGRRTETRSKKPIPAKLKKKPCKDCGAVPGRPHKAKCKGDKRCKSDRGHFGRCVRWLAHIGGCSFKGKPGDFLNTPDTKPTKPAAKRSEK